MTVVTQGDREAAAEILKFAGMWSLARKVREGRADDNLTVELLAAHRIAALEEAAKVAEGLKREVPYEHNQYPCTTTMGRIATAIRALKGDTDV